MYTLKYICWILLFGKSLFELNLSWNKSLTLLSSIEFLSSSHFLSLFWIICWISAWATFKCAWKRVKIIALINTVWFIRIVVDCLELWRVFIMGYLDPPALFLHRNDFMLLMVSLSAALTNRSLVLFAEHLQRPVVFSAEVSSAKGGRIRQTMLHHHRIPQMRAQVHFTIRRLADQAWLHCCQLVFAADVASYSVRFQGPSGGMSPWCWLWFAILFCFYRSLC